MTQKFHKLESRQWVPHPFEKVASLFKNPNVLDKLSPPHMNASIECDGETKEGAQVVIKMKAYGIFPLNWVSKIFDVTETSTLFKFSDIQLSGPFSHWKHTHIIKEADKDFNGRSGAHVSVDQPGTWIEDSVEYQMPLSIAGAIAHKVFAKSQLESMFAYRKKIVLELLNQS